MEEASKPWQKEGKGLKFLLRLCMVNKTCGFQLFLRPQLAVSRMKDGFPSKELGRFSWQVVMI